MIEFDHELPEMQSIADVLAHIRDRAEVLGEGKWIVIQQVFITRLEEKRYPTRDELDSAAPNNPVVFRTGPDASLNSQALTHFNIGIESKDPEGSKIERDSVGNPTGILRGWSRIVNIPDAASSSPQQADRLARLQTLFRDYNATGITGIIDRNTSTEGMGLYHGLESSKELNVRVAMSRAVGNKESAERIREQIRAIGQEPAKATPTAMLRTVGIKMFLGWRYAYRQCLPAQTLGYEQGLRY